MTVQISFPHSQEWCLVQEQAAKMFLAASFLTWHPAMHSLNILNMYSQCMKDWVNWIPPSTWIASLRASLFSALTSTFTLALPSEQGLSSCRFPLLLLSPYSLRFSHTALFVDPWHSRYTLAPGLFLGSETFLFQIRIEIPQRLGLCSNVTLSERPSL